VSLLMLNISKDETKFNDLEEKMWKKKMQEGLNELREQLREIDNKLLKNKNNKELEVKDFQKTTVKCKFGDLEFYRRRYKLKRNGETRIVYLLDIYLELGYSGQYSQSIVEMVIKEAIEKSYRKTAETIRETTNVSITHTIARKILIDFSEKHIEKLEKEKLKLYEKGYIEGEKEQKIIYEEADGIYISKQNRKKNKAKRKGKKLKSEIKIGIIHEGFEKRYSNDFRVKNKQMIATTKSAKYFKRLVDMAIGTKYKENKIERIIINADGADWCKDIAESPKERYQLYMFHIQKRITEAVTNREYKELMSGIVKTNKPEYIFNIIYNYKVELEYDKNYEELEKIQELEKYLRNNEKGLLRYQYDLGLTEKEIEKLEETEYRNLGTEESQVYCGCRKRMKKNRTSWSDRGSEAMVKVISYVKSNMLEDLITGKMEKEIESEISERIPEPKKVKKVKVGKIRYATQNTILESLTGFRKLKVKGLLRNKSFNEMRIIGN